MKEINYHYINELEQTNWWYRARRDNIDRILSKLGKFNSTLDLGCGVGSNLTVLQKHAKKVTGLDYSKTAIDFTKKRVSNVTLFLGDAQNLKFKNESFDLVLCTDVLEHLDDKKAVLEIHRVLKKDGCLILTVPAHKYLWNSNDDLSEHKRRYEKKELRQLLNSHFNIKQMNYWNFLFYFPAMIFSALEKTRKITDKKNNLQHIPAFLNNILFRLMQIENKLSKIIHLPDGVSIVCVARKK